jgi:hypothetical protein
MKKEDIEFREVQRFTQWWLWVILSGIGVIPIFGIYKQLIQGEKFGNNPMPDIGLIIFSILIFALLALFWLMQLKTVIDRHAIRMSLFPFVRKTIRWNDIRVAEVVNYGFVGGWGIRLGTKYGTVYNMKGNIGLSIILNSGKKFCIGTQKEAELREFIKNCFQETSSK